jgi:hypothetical protein
MVDHVVAVAADLQPLFTKCILLSQREDDLVGQRNNDVKRAVMRTASATVGNSTWKVSGRVKTLVSQR